MTPCLQRTYVYRLYPNKTQEQRLGTHLEFCRRLYNAALEQRIFAYKECGVGLNGYRQCRDLTALRQEMPDLVPEGMNAWCQQDAIRRLDLAYQAFFRRLKNGEKPGFPRCKGINRYRTLAYDLNGKGGGMRVQADGRGVAIAAIGKMRMRGGRGLPEDAKLLQGKLTRRAGGRWFLSVSMRVPKPEDLPATGENVGVDVGVNVFAALSSGEIVAGPNAFKNAKDELAAAQQRVERRQRGSSRQRKAKAQVSRLHERISNQRRDHAHKTARALISLFDVIVFESLQITNMTKSAAGTLEAPGTNVAAKSGLNRAISDQGWSYFMKVTTDKAEEAGRLVMKVNPAYSSRDCSQCAHRCKDDVCFRGRLYVCSVCGLKLNRDVNAARVILDRGLQALAEVEGLAEVEFVEPSKAVKRDDGSQQRKAVKQTSG